MERFMKLAATTALFLFGVAMGPIAANAGQLKTATVPSPKVSGPKVTFHDINATKTTNTSSPNLYRGVFTGKHIKTATITVRKQQ
jgi:type VI protein secretion system component Hcp